MPKKIRKPDVADDDETADPAPIAVTKPSRAIANEAALLFKLQELTGGVDVDSDEAWLETLTVTAPDPLVVEDVEDDLKRELALCVPASILTSIRMR